MRTRAQRQVGKTLWHGRTGRGSRGQRWRAIAIDEATGAECIGDFGLRLTIESGQFFRFDEEAPGTFLLLTQGKAIRVRQERGGKRGEIMFRDDGVGTSVGRRTDEMFVKRLLGIDEGQRRAMARLMRDPALAPLAAKYRGLRIMRQDLYETIIAFLCSSQSNIPKIRMNLRIIAHNSGRMIGGHAHLPRPGTALDHGKLLAAKTGYRAKYIAQASRMLTPQFLRKLRKATYAKSHALLQEIPGVGPKIADCVCLFALGHGEAFPVDVHVLRAMRALFPEERFKDELAAKYFAQQRWGGDAGLAQQIVYQWARDTLSRGTHKKRKDNAAERKNEGAA